MKPAALLTLIALLAPLAFAHAGTRYKSAVARGRYLTRVGGCKTCHTRPGHPAFAGGRAIHTPFGVVFTPNITPNKATGIGNWSGQDFYQALHNGSRPNGDALYPAFPYPVYTKLRRDDVMDIWAYLRTIKPVHQKNRENALHWPYGTRIGLRIWRILYFNPGAYTKNPAHDAQWNRGAYLVQALAHCGTCHTPRNHLGATDETRFLGGGTVPVDGWNAPDITPLGGTGIGTWSADTLKHFLLTGRSRRGDALGPMREVVQSNLRYLTDSDANAIVKYLRQLPVGPPHRNITTSQGRSLYRKNCADCHGKTGRAAHAYYPDLRNSRLITEENPGNLILMILRGGFQATTMQHPYPHSMPPFATELRDRQIADIVNYVRRNWQNRPAKRVSPDQIGSLR